MSNQRTFDDRSVALEGPHPIFGQDQSAEAVQELVQANFLAPTQMEVVFTPVVVNTGHDSCYSTAAIRRRSARAPAIWLRRCRPQASSRRMSTLS